MNLAIIIGISQYDNAKPLSACEEDAEAISEILENCNEKWDHILLSSQYESSEKIRKAIADFFDSHKSGKRPDQLLFYYSGHGYIDSNEFYFTASNFSETNPNDTGLSNEEIDSYLLQARANLTIKIVDACHAGAISIKDSQEGLVKKILENTGHRFSERNMYFFLSCRSHQGSRIERGHRFSLFTERLIYTLDEFDEEQPILYRSVQAKLADSFRNHPAQSPVYAMWGSNTEKLSDMTVSLKKYLKDVTEEAAPRECDETNTIECVETSDSEILVKRVEERESRLIKKKEMSEILSRLKDEIEEFEFDEVLCKLFEISTDFLNNLEKTDTKVAAQWLDTSEHRYFVQFEYDEETDYVQEWVQKPPRPFLANQIASLLGGDYVLEKVPKKRKVLSGFTLCDSDLQYYSVRLSFDRIYRSTCSYSAEVLFAYSDELITFFYRVLALVPYSWDEFSRHIIVNWRQITNSFAGDYHSIPGSVANEIMLGIQKTVLDHLDSYLC